MNVTKMIRRISIVIAIMLMAMGCGKKKSDAALSDEARKVCGSWAYSHDKETPAVIFRSDGTAQYEGKDYTFESDGQFIELKDKENETKKLRYVLEKDDMYLYSTNTYILDGTKNQDGLTGKWKCSEKNWSFEFTKEGTFMEDGFFPGHYIVNEEESSIKLMYNDHFEDTVCYYQIDGDELSIEYPWRMVDVNAE